MCLLACAISGNYVPLKRTGLLSNFPKPAIGGSPPGTAGAPKAARPERAAAGPHPPARNRQAKRHGACIAPSDEETGWQQAGTATGGRPAGPERMNNGRRFSHLRPAAGPLGERYGMRPNGHEAGDSAFLICSKGPMPTKIGCQSQTPALLCPANSCPKGAGAGVFGRKCRRRRVVETRKNSPRRPRQGRAG